MFQPLSGFPDGTVALRGTGTVTLDDYREILIPAVKRATSADRKARLLLVLGEGFDGYDPGAVLADTALGVTHLGSFERIAVVTDEEWIRRGVHLLGGMIPSEVRLFRVAAEGDAAAWIRG